MTAAGSEHSMMIRTLEGGCVRGVSDGVAGHLSHLYLPRGAGR